MDLIPCPCCGKEDGLSIDSHIQDRSNHNTRIVIGWVISCEYCDFESRPTKVIVLKESNIKFAQIAP